MIESGANPTPRWVRPATIFLWLLAAAGLVCVASALFVAVPRVNEGWNAVHALHAVTRPNLYLFDGYANFPNYPPLAFYPAGWLGMLLGDMIFSGRLLAMAGMAVIAVNVGLAARHLNAPAYLAVGLYVVLTLGMAHYYVGSSDPQFMGHALQTVALPLLLGRRTAPAIAAAALLCVLGGLVKLNLIALPLAATLWLALIDRRALVTWLVTAISASAAAVVCCYLAFGTAVFAQVLGHERIYDLSLIGGSIRWMGGYLPLAVAGLVLAVRRRRDPNTLLLGLYLATAIIAGVLFASGLGVNLNTYFDMGIASAPLGVAAIFQLRRKARVITLAFVGVAVVYLTLGTAPIYLSRLNASAEAPTYVEAVRTLAGASDPVLCDDLALCYWAGKESILDRSNTAQKLLRGPAAVAAFEASLAANPPATMQFDPSGGGIVGRSISTIAGDYHVIREPPIMILARNATAGE